MTITADQFRSETFRRLAAEAEARGEEKGEARGEAKSILSVLQLRGLSVPDEMRARVLACSEPEQLEIWLRRALTVTAAEDLFDPAT